MKTRQTKPVMDHDAPPCRPTATKANRFQGCLLGGAVGDALGAAVEFLTLSEIIRCFGDAGVTDYALAYGRLGAITDDTQLTLFTADGMLRANVRASLKGTVPAFQSVTSHAYLRWLYTQGVAHPALSLKEPQGWLIRYRELFAQRAPGQTCLSSLKALHKFGDRAFNSSKGCGALMRVAPVGMYMANWIRKRTRASIITECFAVACDIAALTHGHPSGQLPAGVFACVTALALTGHPLVQALWLAKDELRKHRDHEETLVAIERAEELARCRPCEREVIPLLGKGWVAGEALAISLYCALSASHFASGVLLAINHSGDSDSTGAITGNLLGALLGRIAIPTGWLDRLELRNVIEEVANDLATLRQWDLDPYTDTAETDYYWNKYPGY